MSKTENSKITPKEGMIHDLDNLEKLGIVYFSIVLEGQKDNNGEWKFDEKQRLKKTPSQIQNYRNKKMDTIRNDKLNATMIPLGPRYNLIGIDVDNKGKTLKKFKKILDNNGGVKTLKIKTMNDGYHYYFKLSKNQYSKLEEMKFKSKNDALYGLHIDVKYDNQVFFGPSVVKADKIYTYKILNSSKPATLPDFLFTELVKNIDITPEKEIKENKKNKKEKPEKRPEEETEKTEKNEEDKRLKPYLECLKKERWDKYEDWFKLGSVIYNEDGSFELFKTFSKTSPKYELEECKKKWKEYKKNDGEKITIATLIKMAQEDNPIKCRKAQKNDNNFMIYKIFNEGITDKTACDVFYFGNNDKYLYDEVNEEWYYINKYNIWVKDKKGYELHKNVGLYMEKVINKYASELIENIKINNDKKDKLIKNWSKAIKYVSNNKTKKNIVNELICYYKRNKIYEKMDNVNDYLFAFDNGVYDLKDYKFRLPEPEELITSTCGYNYDRYYDKKSMDDIHNILNEMFEKEEDKDYVMYTIAQCLSGIPSKEKFYLWRGQGRNGKGTLRDLIMYTFGSYYNPMEIEYINKTKHGSSATSADEIISTKKNCRIVITTEPDATMQLKTNKICQWSGKDPIQCRGLYGKAFTFIPKFKLFIQSNYDLSFGGSNVKAMLERNEVMEFPYSFVQNPIQDNEKQADTDLKERIKQPGYDITFFHLLLKYYKKFIENKKNIILPESAKEQTKIFFIASDPFSPFYEDIVMKVGDTTKFVKSSDLYSAFKKYNNDSTVNMSTQEFKAALIGKGLKPSTQKGCIIWRGIQLNIEKLNNTAKNENINVDFND